MDLNAQLIQNALYKKPDKPQVPFDTAQGGGFSYTPTEHLRGFPEEISRGIGDAAGFLLQGTAKAQAETQRAYERLFMQRALGDTFAFEENERRIGGESAATGLSPDLARLGSFQRQAGLQGMISAERAGAESEEAKVLAELAKGTGGELASLKMNENAMALSAYEAELARAAARKAGNKGLLGSAIGAAATVGGSYFGGFGLGAGLASASGSGPSFVPLGPR